MQDEIAGGGQWILENCRIPVAEQLIQEIRNRKVSFLMPWFYVQLLHAIFAYNTLQ